MTITNRFKGTCLTCRTYVAPNQGTATKVDGSWSVFCRKCGPSPRPSIGQELSAKAPDATIALRFVSDRIQIRPAGYLGAEMFDAYRAACGGAEYSRNERCNYATVDLVGAIVTRLAKAGFKLDTDPAITAAVQAWEARAQQETAAAEGRAAEIDALLRARGLALFPFQAQGVSWLAPRGRAILGDDMGCIDGAAVVRCNRAGKGFAIALSDLFARFNGGKARSGPMWNLSIPTYVRALCDGELRQHRVTAVLDRGVRNVVKLTLASGKTLRLTPDHEVARPDGTWTRADHLMSTDLVFTNGTKVDKDGYVRVYDRTDHPRHTTGGVYEHILVMEQKLGRRLESGERVHHRNEIKHDNRPNNLSLMTHAEHAAHHGRDGGYRKLDGAISGRGGLVKFIPSIDSVVSVVADGSTHVYDIVCADPYRNFVANGIVVHNCGKTVQALAALPEGARAVVVGPAVAKGVWERECKRWRPDLTPVVLSGRGSFRWPSAGELVITNYDVLSDAPLEAKDRAELNAKATKAPIESAAKLMAKIAADDAVLELHASVPAGLCVIADEAHAVKGKRNKVARCARFGALADAAFEAGGRVWLLTATPILNSPPELWNLLSLIRAQKIVFGSYPNFKRLCGGASNGFGTTWEAGGIDAGSIGPKLREVMLRRMKTDVLDQLPAKTVEIVEVALDTSTMKRLDAITAELAAQGIDLAAAIKAAASSNSIAFEQIARARALLATAKAAHAMAMADDLEEAGEPAIVFSAHRAPVDVLAQRPGWATITGDTPPAERTKIEESFQRGELRGIAGTIKAMGVAITLTRACHVIFIDSEWTPKLNEQAEDRAYRIGQARAVNIVYLKADHDVDDRVFELCAIKRGIVARTVDAAAHRDGALAQRTNASDALASARASGDSAQRERDNEELAAKVRVQRAKADADRVRRQSAVKSERANTNRGWSIPPEAFETTERAAATPAEEWAVLSLAALTAMDGDYAREDNGVGFSQADTTLGHALSTGASAGMLNDGEWKVALLLLRKYHGQIGEAP